MVTQLQVESLGASGAATVGPEWDSIQEEILCPLCDYNLRGLIEPRCPECGYRFEWVDLLDPRRQRHPFAFEHHPERKVWSAWKTARGLLSPKIFWQSLHPVQPSYPWRLIQYWLLTVGILLMADLYSAAAGTAAVARANAGQITSSRAFMAAYFASPKGAAEANRIVQRYGSVQAFLNQRYSTVPDYWAAAKWIVVLAIRTCPMMLALVAWPWLTILTLLLFRISMAQRKVRAIHVMRCVLYNQDALCLTAISIVLVWRLATNSGRLSFLAVGALIVAALGAAAVAEAIFAYRIAVAYARYLRFDHPYSTILASQIISALVALTAFTLPLVLGS